MRTILSNRPDKTGCMAKGKSGKEYYPEDEPGVVYIVGKGFYWSGPVEETEEVPGGPLPTPIGLREVLQSNAWKGNSVAGHILNTAMLNAAMPGPYRHTFYFDPAIGVKNGESFTIEYTVGKGTAEGSTGGS